MRRGEVWWARLPAPVGTRPVVVLTRDEVVNAIDGIVVCIVTRTIRGLHSELIIGSQEGLDHRSAASLDNLLTIPRGRFIEHVGNLSAEKMVLLDEALCFALGVNR